MVKNILKFLIAVVLLVITFFLYQKHKTFYAPNVPENLKSEFIEIPTGSTFEEVVGLLEEGNFILDEESFREAAEWMKYKKPVMRAGKFKIVPGWSNHQLVRHLRGGDQTTVKLVLHNERLPETVAAKVARFIEPDSLDLVTLFHDEAYLESIGYTRETLQSLFIPNTYDFFWTTSPKQFVERMLKEHEKFWNRNNRKAKADSLNMTPQEVYTLASIIEKETNQNAEKRRMAGVYLNRLTKNMLLQADPTCVFATRDFTTNRVTDYHLNFDSPYNTYLYPGLPPGPIAMASIASIDAVLNAEKNDYIFFCAKGDGSGLHAFAKTLAGHNQNVARYRRNLRKW